MKLVMVGGHSRNVGKTSVVEGIIRGLPEFDWTAVNITQFGHGVCSADGEPCECATAEHGFSITDERRRDSGTDTARFLSAGARRALWVRTRQGDLFQALDAFAERIAAAGFVIVESNSLRRFMKPSLYLQVLDPANPDFKASAQQFFDLADAYLVVRAPDSSADASAARSTDAQVLLSREMERGKPVFAVKAADGFVNPDVISFVRSNLESGNINAA